MELRPAVTFTSPDPERLRAFWTGLLRGHTATVELRFEAGDVDEGAPESLHLHLTSESGEHREATIARVLAHGGSRIDDRALPAEDHIVVADPDGCAWCVIEPGNRWLAGTGYLGEVACSGTPAVGRFWSAALDWPLVWEEGDETAIQSPQGGTKIAWSGDPGALGPTSTRLDLIGALAAADRLVSVGATLVSQGLGWIDLLDPDGTPLRLHAA